jgi:hypothetical protein
VIPESQQAPDAARRPGRRGILRRWWFWLLVVVVLIAVVAVVAGAIAGRALEARDELESASILVPELQDQAAALEIDAAQDTLDSILGHTGSAAELADGTLWRLGEAVPVLGVNLTAMREIAAVTDDVMTDVAVPLVGVAGSIDPTSFTPVDGAIDIQPLIDAAPAVEQARIGVAAAVASVAAINTDGTIDEIAGATEQLAGLLERIAPTIESLGTIVPLLPPALGSEAPRTYVLMVQNPAESRALGGAALSFVEATVDEGRIQFAAPLSVSPIGGDFVSYPEPLIEVPDGVDEIFPGSLGTFLANATTRPSFTTAAEITRATWNAQFGYDIDGVLSMDPLVLSYLLRGSDPIPVATGDQITSENAVDVLLNGVYAAYNTEIHGADNIAQDAVYAQVIDETFARLMSGRIDAATFVDALTQGWAERRLLYWSAIPEEQAQLAAIGLNGEIPLSDSATERVGVYFTDNTGSKLNYYLRQEVRLGSADCRADGRQSNRVTVDLTNQVDPAEAQTLARSILGTFRREGVERGEQRLIVLLYAPPGSIISGATVAGAPVQLQELHDTEFPVGKLIVLVRPGETVTLSYDFVSPGAGEKRLEAQVTPMVQPATISTEPLDCATVASVASVAGE